MNTREFPALRRVCKRTSRRHEHVASILPSIVPLDRSANSVPQYRPLILDNQSATMSASTNCSDSNTDLPLLELSAIDYQNQHETGSDNNVEDSEIIEDDFDFAKAFANIIIKYSVSYSAAEELLSIINSAFGYKKLPKKMKTIFRQMDECIYTLTYKFICNCMNIVTFVSSNGYIPSNIMCSSCAKVFNGYNDIKQYPFYFCLPIKQQIEYLSRLFPKPSNTLIAENGVLNLELILATDAIPIFKSVNASLHVMVIFIDNMEKFGKDALPILSTLYYGKGKPHLDTFFKDFLSEYKQIGTNTFNTDWNDRTRAYLKCIIADAPCRAWILGLQQFNGRYGCSRCYIETQASKYPIYTSEQIKPRTLSETEVLRLQSTADTRYGVINCTPLSSIKDFDYISCTLIEYTHCAILGVTKNLVQNIILESLWGTRVFINSARPSVNYFNERFKSIFPPSSIKRFRTLSEIAHWKSSEFENFLFYYSYFLFKEKMKTEYQFHIMKLASALSKLLSFTDVRQVSEAKEEIDEFLKLVLTLKYPDTLHRYNTHSLLHLVDDAAKFGQLNRLNAYGYENFLGYLKKLVKCPINVSQQIIYKTKISQTIDTYRNELIFKNKNIPPDHVYNAFTTFGIPKEAIRIFSKCVYGKSTFKSYKEGSKKGDYNVELNDRMYRVLYFAEAMNTKYIYCQQYKILSNVKLQSMGMTCLLYYAFYVEVESIRKIIPINGRLKPLIAIHTPHNTLMFKIITKNN